MWMLYIVKREKTLVLFIVSPSGGHEESLSHGTDFIELASTFSAAAQNNIEAHRRLSLLLTGLSAHDLRSGRPTNSTLTMMSYMEIEALIQMTCD